MEFVASNGIDVRTMLDGGIRLTEDFRFDVPPPEVRALREFFQHERDEALGRWRWPENPDYVVYPTKSPYIYVHQEGMVVARQSVYRRDQLPKNDGLLTTAAARAYFAAHPESKPWHDAKPGEVWVLTENGNREHVRRVTEAGGEFGFELIVGGGWIPLFDARITSARRIWPEVF